MRNKIVLAEIFGLPSTSNKAREVFYAVMLVGVIFVPMFFLVYKRFIAPHMKMSTEEFFVIFSAIYMLLFILCTARTSNVSINLRKQFGSVLPRDVMLAAPVIANSGISEIIVLGKKYWFWQLISSYFTGITFSWLVYLFILYVI